MKALGTRMRKLVLGLSLAQILPGKIDEMLFQKKHGFIDMNRTVFIIFFRFLVKALVNVFGSLLF